ncbi:hypothetical protein DSECCO2_104590 [anaerobic digester metagenome]
MRLINRIGSYIIVIIGAILICGTFFIVVAPIIALVTTFFGLIGFTISLVALVCISALVLHYYSRRAVETKALICSKPELNSNGNHHAIIVAHSKGLIKKTHFFSKHHSESDYPESDYMDGIDILIEHFINSEPPIPYKIYEVITKEEALIPIESSNTSHIWIFGHGQRNLLGFKSGNLCYPTITNAPEKIFVGQYHCNSILGTSLAEITKAELCDVTRCPRVTPFIRMAVRKKLKELACLDHLMPKQYHSTE